MHLKRILALAAVFLLFFLYAASLFLAFSGSPGAGDLLLASLFCTMVIPAVFYSYHVLLRSTGPREGSADSRKSSRSEEETAPESRKTREPKES